MTTIWPGPPGPPGSPFPSSPVIRERLKDAQSLLKPGVEVVSTFPLPQVKRKLEFRTPFSATSNFMFCLCSTHLSVLCFIHPPESPSHGPPRWSPPRRRTRLQASPSNSLFRSLWTALKRNSSSCRRSITGACRASPGDWWPGQPCAPRRPAPWRRRLYLVLASRRWRVESQLKAVLRVTPFPGSSRAASCLLLLPLFPFCGFAAVPGSLFSCI